MLRLTAQCAICSACLLAVLATSPRATSGQFAYIDEEVQRTNQEDETSPQFGPVGRLLSSDFAEQKEDWRLGALAAPAWRHDAAPWLRQEALVTPTLFDGQKPSSGTIPQIGRIHTAREWRAWRRHRRRWSDSWLFFPISVTKFSGLLQTAEPVHDQIKKGDGSLSGVRLGWDFAPRLGVESRLGFARQALRDLAQGGSLAHENFILWNTDLMIYPWGDRPWRPYIAMGLGLADVRFIDSQSVFWHQSLLVAPIGVGLQYRFNNRAALRVDVNDNMLLRSSAGGGGRHLQHDLSVCIGFEARFTRPHKPYFNYPHSRLDGLRGFLRPHSD